MSGVPHDDEGAPASCDLDTVRLVHIRSLDLYAQRGEDGSIEITVSIEGGRGCEEVLTLILGPDEADAYESRRPPPASDLLRGWQ